VEAAGGERPEEGPRIVCVVQAEVEAKVEQRDFESFFL
jgi:hypothetical protein